MKKEVNNDWSNLYFLVRHCAGVVGTAIYNVKKTRQFWHDATLGMTDFDIKCMNYEYAWRKSKGNKKEK